MELSQMQREKGMEVVTPIPANQQQQPSQSPHQQPLYCVPLANLLSLQQLQEIQQQGYAVLVPVAASASVPVAITRQMAMPRRGGPPKKVREPKQPLHANSVCANCHATETSMWRRNRFGQPECNACNLYLRKKRVFRPLELAGKEILRRKRFKPVASGGRFNSLENNSSSSSVADHDYGSPPCKKSQFTVQLSTTSAAAAAAHHQPESPDFGEEPPDWEAQLHQDIAEMVREKEGNNDAGGIVLKPPDAGVGWEEKVVNEVMGDQLVVQQEEELDFEKFFNDVDDDFDEEDFDDDPLYGPYHMGENGYEYRG